MIKTESAEGIRRNPHIKDECKNCTLAGELQADCGCCEHVDYCHAGNLQIQLCHLLKLAFPIYGMAGCHFKPWRGWEDCFKQCAAPLAVRGNTHD